jgi:hypothetical protein
MPGRAQGPRLERTAARGDEKTGLGERWTLRWRCLLMIYVFRIWMASDGVLDIVIRA